MSLLAWNRGLRNALFDMETLMTFYLDYNEDVASFEIYSQEGLPFD